MNLAIVGSREFSNYDYLDQYIQAWVIEHGRPNLIISGGATGVDAVAEQWAHNNGIPFQVFPANWHKYGGRAGPVRNTQIVRACTHVLAFPAQDSRGTRDTISKAQAANKNVTVHEI